MQIMNNKNGLELILRKIEDDNNKITTDIIEKSIKESKLIFEETESDALKQAEKILSDSEKESERIEENEKSESESYIKNEILKEKNLFMDNMVKKAFLEFSNSDDYFEKTEKMILKYAYSEKNGEIIFGESDFKKLPSAFLKNLNRNLKQKKASLTLASPSPHFNGGFILKYDDAEENCTFKELFEERKNEIADSLQKLIKENI